MTKKTLLVARTGIVIALAVVIQLFGGTVLAVMGTNKQFVIGSLINACLLVATASGGLAGGAIVSFVTPLIAAFTGQAAVAAFILPFSPVIGLGNFALVFFFWLFTRKNKSLLNSYIGIGMGAIVKFCILFIGVHIGLSLISIAEPLQVAIKFMFSWPQLVTAVIGGLVATAIITKAWLGSVDRNEG